jgi:hypothetical protein
LAQNREIQTMRKKILSVPEIPIYKRLSRSFIECTVLDRKGKERKGKDRSIGIENLLTLIE